MTDQKTFATCAERLSRADRVVIFSGAGSKF